MQNSDLRRRKRKSPGASVDIRAKYKELISHYETLKTKYEEQTKLVLMLKDCPSCPTCGRKFDTQKNLDKHFYKNHPQLRSEYDKIRGYTNDKTDNIVSEISQQLKKLNKDETNTADQHSENNVKRRTPRQRNIRRNESSIINGTQEYSTIEGQNENSEKKTQEEFPRIISRVDHQQKSNFACKQSENDVYVPEIEILTKEDVPQPERLLLKDRTPKAAEPEITVVPYNPPPEGPSSPIAPESPSTRDASPSKDESSLPLLSGSPLVSTVPQPKGGLSSPLVPGSSPTSTVSHSKDNPSLSLVSVSPPISNVSPSKGNPSSPLVPGSPSVTFISPPKADTQKSVRGELLALKRQMTECPPDSGAKNNETKAPESDVQEPSKNLSKGTDGSSKSTRARRKKLFDEDEMFDNLQEISFFRNGAFNDDDFVEDDDAPPL